MKLEIGSVQSQRVGFEPCIVLGGIPLSEAENAEAAALVHTMRRKWGISMPDPDDSDAVDYWVRAEVGEWSWYEGETLHAAVQRAIRAEGVKP